MENWLHNVLSREREHSTAGHNKEGTKSRKGGIHAWPLEGT